MRRAILLLLLIAFLSAAWVAYGLPPRSAVRAQARTNPGITAVMRQREEEARRAGRPVRRVQVWVPISGISRHLIHAVIASEDQKFFGHEGVDWEAIKQSVEVDRARGRFVRGGSTITQQLAKNLFFTTRKSVIRKLRELVVARWLEEELGKKRILELYLNVIEWGDGLYGCEAAARRYYAKSSASLDAVEAAGLAGMIPNPRRITPIVDPRRFARAQRRVLWLMAQAGYVRQDMAGLGAEPPPPEPAEEDEEEPPPPGPTPAATTTPEPEEVPRPEATPLPEATATPTPDTTPTPEPPGVP
jgi:monofunctional biosynthetic peptidoglycan transglycosylase